MNNPLEGIVLDVKDDHSFIINEEGTLVIMDRVSKMIDDFTNLEMGYFNPAMDGLLIESLIARLVSDYLMSIKPTCLDNVDVVHVILKSDKDIMVTVSKVLEKEKTIIFGIMD